MRIGFSPDPAALKTFSKKRSKKRLVIFAILFMLAAFVTYVLLTLLLTKPPFNPVDTSIKVVSTMPRPSDVSIDELSPLDNVRVAAGVIWGATYFEGVTHGEVKALGGAYTQNVDGKRFKLHNRIFHESISSGVVGVAEQKLFTMSQTSAAEDEVLYSSGAKSGGGYSWSDVSKLSLDNYSARYGLFPREICKYVISDETVLSAEKVEALPEQASKIESVAAKDGELYSYRLTLDAGSAAKYYAHEMMTMGGSSAYPVFSEIVVTFTMNSNWIVTDVSVQEKYKIKIPVLGEMACTGNLTEKFYNIEESGINYATTRTLPSDADRFIAVSGGKLTEGDISRDKNAVDYLTEGFGEYLSGKPVKLEADVDLFGNPLDLTMSVDTKNLAFGLNLKDALVFGFDGSDVFFKFGEQTKGKIKLSSLTNALTKAGFTIDLGALGGAGGESPGFSLDTLLADISLAETPSYATVKLPFTLMDIAFDVELGMVKTDDGAVADRIFATIDLSRLDDFSEIRELLDLKSPLIKVRLCLNDDLAAVVPDESYSDVSGVAEFLPAITSLIESRGISVSGAVGIVSDAFSGTVVIDADISRRENATDADITAEFSGIKLDISIRGDVAYIKTGNICLKADLGDIGKTVNALDTKSAGGAGGAIDGIVDMLISNLLPEKLDLNSVTKLLSTLKFENGTLSLSVEPASGNSYSAALTLKDGSLKSAAVTGLMLGGIGIDVSAELKNAQKEPLGLKTVSDADYIDVSSLTSYIDVIQKLAAAKEYRFGIALELNNNDLSLPVSGDVTVSTDGALKVRAELLIAGEKVTVIFIDNAVYAKLGALTVKLDLNDIEKFTAALSPYVSLPAGAADGLFDLTLSLGETANLISNLIDSVDSITESNGVLTVCASGEFSALGSEHNLSLKFALSNDGDSGISLDIERLLLDGYELSASLSVTASGAASEITAPVSYLNLADFIEFIAPVMDAVNASLYEFDVTAAYGDIKADISARVIRDKTENGEVIKAELTLTAAGISIDVALDGGEIFVSAGNIKVKATLSELPGVIESVMTLLGKENGGAAAVPDMANILDSLDFLLPELDFKGITDVLSSLKVGDGKVSATVIPRSGDSYNAEFTVKNGSVSTLKVDGVTINGKALILTAAATLISNDKGELTPFNRDAYVDINDLIAYLEPIKSLVSAQSFGVKIDGNIVISAIDKYLETHNSTKNISADLLLSLGETMSMHLDAATDERMLFGHELSLSYTGGTLYLSLNDGLKLSLESKNIGEIISIINSAIPSDMPPLELPTLDGLALPPLSELLTYVESLTYTDNKLNLNLIIGGLSLTLSVAKPDGNGLDMSLAATMTDADGTVFDISLDGLSIYDISESEKYIPAPADADKYVKVEDIADFIEPTIATITEKYFDIDFFMSLESAPDAAAASDLNILGRLEILPVTTISNVSFPELYLQLYIGSDPAIETNYKASLSAATDAEKTTLTNKAKAAAQHKLHLMLKKDADGQLRVHLNYNELRVNLSYNTALKIVGALTSILGLEIPPLESIIGDVYYDEPLDTSLFEGMNIVGLNELRDAINGFFKAGEGAGSGISQFEKILNDLLSNSLNSALRGISLEQSGGTLLVGISNGLINDNGLDSLASITLKRTVTEKLADSRLSALDIDNLRIGDNIINANVSLRLPTNESEKVLPDPDTMDVFRGNDNYKNMNFDSIYNFLDNVVTTAGVEQFHIKGTANVNIVGIELVYINVDLKVKIVDAGTENQRVLVGLELYCDGLAGVIEEFRSHLYFDGSHLYLEQNTWNEPRIGKDKYWTKRVKVEPAEFIDNIVEYVLFLVPFKDSWPFYVESKIRESANSSGSGGGGSSIDIAKLLTNYSYNGSDEYSLDLNMGELTSMLGNMNLKLNSKMMNNKYGKQHAHLYSFSLSTKVFGMLNINFSANLKNLENGNVFEPLGNVAYGFSGKNQRYSSTPIENMPSFINTLTWGTRYNDRWEREYS